MVEKDSLHIFLMLLLGTTNGEGVLEGSLEESGNLQMWKEKWEVKFARDLCQEYEPKVWLPALVKLLEVTSTSTSPAASQFITYQLQGLSDNNKVHVPQVIFLFFLFFLCSHGVGHSIIMPPILMKKSSLSVVSDIIIFGLKFTDTLGGFVIRKNISAIEEHKILSFDGIVASVF